jgi:Uma2 family endonuclease
MATASLPLEQHFVLDEVDWTTYGRLLRALGNRTALRLTYDRGSLEIMTLSHEHESDSYLLGRLVDALTEELGLPVKGGRSTTFRRRKSKRGLEPDACWWISNEASVRGKIKIDLRVDPPPDLALEVDVTHSSLNRLAIYASLKMPEIWRLDGRVVICHLLDADGQYQVAETSRAFPGLRPAELEGFLKLRGKIDENTIVRQFREWIRQQIRLKPNG